MVAFGPGFWFTKNGDLFAAAARSQNNGRPVVFQATKCALRIYFREQRRSPMEVTKGREFVGNTRKATLYECGGLVVLDRFGLDSDPETLIRAQ